MYEDEFSRRLAQLRSNKGVSARDMSLSIGQNPGYINTIENGKAFPTMQSFFYICDFLGVTPKEFFDFEASDPASLGRLSELAKHLAPDELDAMLVIADGLADK